MAGFQPVGNTVEIIQRVQRLGHVEINTFYVAPTTSGLPITVAQLQALLLYWAAQITPTFLDCISSSAAAIELTARDLSNATGAQANRLLGSGFNGTRDNTCNPGNCSVGLRRKTDTPGKKFHGRIELPSIGKNDVTNDTVVNNLRDLIIQLLIQLAINFVASDGTNWKHVHASRDAGISKNIVAWVFDTIVDSQSTRLTGHGT